MSRDSVRGRVALTGPRELVCVILYPSQSSTSQPGITRDYSLQILCLYGITAPTVGISEGADHSLIRFFLHCCEPSLPSARPAHPVAGSQKCRGTQSTSTKLCGNTVDGSFGVAPFLIRVPEGCTRSRRLQLFGPHTEQSYSFS